MDGWMDGWMDGVRWIGLSWMSGGNGATGVRYTRQTEIKTGRRCEKKGVKWKPVKDVVGCVHVRPTAIIEKGGIIV